MKPMFVKPRSAQRFVADFARRRAAVPRLSWLLLAAAGVAAAIGASEVHDRYQRLDALDAQIARVAAQARAGHARPLARAGAAGGQADQALRSGALRIERDLARPWWTLLDVLEASAAPGINLVQLSFDPQFRHAYVQVEARTLDDVFGYLHRLAAAPGAAGAALVQHELRETAGVRVVSARIAVDAADAGARAPAEVRGATLADAGAAPPARGRP